MQHKDFESVFNPLYERLYPGIYRYVYRIVGNQEEANQIAQQTFTNFYGYLCVRSSVNNAKALVFRIANNICCDYLRKKMRTENLPSEDLLSRNTSGQPEEELLKKERNEVFRRALKTLSSRDQQCLLLYQEGFSYTEIAACMRIKQNSVGKVLSRATEKLVRIIKNGDKQ